MIGCWKNPTQEREYRLSRMVVDSNTSTISIQQYDSKEHLGLQRFFSVIMFCAINGAHGFKHLFIDDSMKAGWGNTKSCMQP